MRYFSICAIAKNETAYLLEWCAFHKISGVEHITIYDNNSIIPISTTVNQYIEEDFVSVVPWNVPEPQMKAYDHYLTNYGHDTKWCAFIDIDEYIVNKTEKSIKELLTRFEKAGSYQISWRLFGSSGHQNKTDGLTIERFALATPISWKENLHTKVICQPVFVEKFNSNPHCVLLKDGYIALSEDFRYVANAWAPHFCANELQLNHYVIRSYDEFCEKIKKGRADTNKYPGKTLQDFKYFDDMATEQDLCAFKYLEAIKQELKRILSLG